MSDISYDVLICGGGMTGAGLASVLALQGLRVAVFESHKPSEFNISQNFDLRISALNKQTQAVLSRTDAWRYIEQMRACPFRRMRVWEMQGFGDISFSSAQVQEDELGYIVENRVTQTALWQVLADMDNVSLLCPEKPVACYRDAIAMVVKTESGNVYRGKLLVAADGGQSLVRQQFGIGTTSSRYQQACLVASVNTALGQQDITWQRFVETGPQAFLPLLGQHGSVVWYHQADAVRWLAKLSNEALAQRIMDEFPAELGHIEVLDKAYFNLQKQHAQTYVQDGLVLIGDAAHMINPLAGQGVNLGFQDIACLDKVIAGAIVKQQDWWQASSLREYQNQRRVANRLMMETMDVFYHGFSNAHPALKWLRNGLLAAAKLTPVRRQVIRHAMGIGSISLPYPKKIRF